MANIILPQAKVLDTISDNATMLVEQNGEIRRYNVTSLTEDFVSQVDNKPKAGFIYPLATPAVPKGFLLCDGTAYSRTEYSELFAAIGIIYGSGDGSTTFNVPNLATRVPVGKGSGYALGATGGEEKHTLTVEEMPSHDHSSRDDAAGLFAGWGNKSGNGWVSASAQGNNGGNWNTANTGGSQAHNNMQPYTVVNYIIATGKDTGVSVQDVITGAQALPLGVEYGGTGATNAATARQNLGIKAIARNLLDNSDFTNPVNQRGAISYTGTYGIDRWRVWDEDTIVNWNINNGIGVETTGQMFQYLELNNIDVTKTYTLAVLRHTEYDEEIIILTKTVEEYEYNSSLRLGLGVENDILIVTLGTGTYGWAALYEGEYTIDTLPEYQPKGYGAELIECRRYYEEAVFTTSFGLKSYSGQKCYASINYRVPKRIRPTVSLSDQFAEGWYTADIFNVYAFAWDREWLDIYTDNTNLEHKTVRLRVKLSADI